MTDSGEYARLPGLVNVGRILGDCVARVARFSPWHSLQLGTVGPVFLLLPLLASCSNIITSDSSDYCAKSEDKKCIEPVPYGFAYSLPQGRLLLTASRKRVSQDDIAGAELAASKAKAAASAAMVVVAKAQKAVTDDKGTDPVALATEKAALDQADADRDAAVLAADAYKTKFDKLTADKDKWLETVTITQLPIGPDPRKRFVANLDHEITRDDTLKLTTVNGLLTTSSATSVDQTPNLLVTVADTVITASAMSTGVALPVPQAPPLVGEKAECKGYDIAKVFDPLDDTDRADLAELLTDASFGVTIQSPQTKGERTIGDDKQVTGLVYRMATSVIISTTDKAPPVGCELVAPVVSQSLLVVVPDTRADFVLPSEAGPFTTTNLTFGFSNGMLTDYTAQRPSELAAIASVPLTILNHIVAIPAQIVQLRLNYVNQATALENADTSFLQARIGQAAAVLNAQTAVQTAQTALAQAQAAQGAGSVNGAATLVNAQTALIQAQEALQRAQAAASAQPTP